MTRLHPCILAKLVYEPNGCLVWTGALDRGYGKANLNDKNLRVHRYLYEALFGLVGTLDLDHLCRNRACANPFHLEPVSRKENLRRGAGAGGVLHKQSGGGRGSGEGHGLRPAWEAA